MTDHLKKTFLVSPLEWGLGHTTRLSAIVTTLISQGHKVVIAADGRSYNFLSEKFQEITIIRIPMRQFTYSKGRVGFFFKLFWQVPGFLRSVKKSQTTIDQLVKKYQPDFILSDNRYGFYHPDVPSVFITHQLGPIPPWPWGFLQPLVRNLHIRYLRNYDQIWIADYRTHPVSGRLSYYEGKNPKVKHIGAISWLAEYCRDSEPSESEYDWMVILSKLDPQRSRLEIKLIQFLHQLPQYKVLMMRGRPRGKDQENTRKQSSNITLVDHLPGEEMAHYIQTTPKIISATGVVTLFDLAFFQKPALFIPTPGQTEQEHVAEYLDREGYGMRVDEKDLTVDIIRSFDPENYKKFPGLSQQGLEKALNQLLRPEQNQADA